jgi:hypothetical protein
MALHWTEFVQLEKDSKLTFERDLFELSKLLGRPAPEFEGAQIDVHGVGRLSWLIRSSVRRNIKSPSSRTLVFTTKEATWVDGLCTATQRMLARLCEEHKAELVDSRFRFYGRRNCDGHPTPSPYHPMFGSYIMDMEILLQCTQDDLLRTRIQLHFDRESLVELRENEMKLMVEKVALLRKRAQLRKTIVKLRTKVAEQDGLIEDLEHHTDEMEEEGEDLCKENNAFLSDDDDFVEEMDCEEEDDEEELVDEEEEPLEAVLEDEEEDPEEPLYQSDADVLELEVPPQ